MTSSSRSTPIFVAACALAALVLTTLTPSAGAQTLEPTSITPTPLFLVRVDDGEFLDPHSAAFTAAGGNGYYSLRFEQPFDPPGPVRFLGQRFDGDDLPVGPERTIPLNESASSFGLQAHRDGGPILALWRERASGSTTAKGRFLNAQGTPLTPVFHVGVPVATNFLGAAFGTPNEALVVYRHLSGETRGRIVASDGSRSPEIVLAGSDARGPSVAAHPDGRYLLVWRDFNFGSAPDYDLRARWIEADGTLDGGPFMVADDASGNPQIAMWPDGRSAITWSSCVSSLPTRSCDLRIRFLDDEGDPTGPARTISPDDAYSHEDPEMAISEDGILLVTWQNYPANPGTFPGDVLFHGVTFDADGTRLATAPVVEILGEVSRRQVVALEDDFLVHWYGFNAQPTDGVFGMRYRFTPAEDGGGGEEPPPPPPPADPDPPAGVEPLTSPQVPGFRSWVRISTPAGSILGSMEATCIPETLCVSGALPGRSEVFLRVVGPRPNGFLWPTIVKFTTSTVEVWIEQVDSGEIRYYELEGSAPSSSELPGLFDRTGFLP